jgi:hydrogenase expression/formation protein HypD
VVTGFEPTDLVQGILAALRQLQEGRAEVENAYPRAVTEAGNREAQDLVSRVFRLCDRAWRGIGVIPRSGLELRPEYDDWDAVRRFDVGDLRPEEPEQCIAGLVLQGRKKPTECAAFGNECTPEHPLGATMVSAEGACAAYYRYGRVDPEGAPR